nr:unnamed protein product [Haemonchus contortus]
MVQSNPLSAGQSTQFEAVQRRIARSESFTFRLKARSRSKINLTRLPTKISLKGLNGAIHSYRAMFVVIFVFALMSIFYYEYNFYTNENFDILSVDDKAESVRDPSNSIANRMRSFSLGHHDEEYAWEVESRLDDHTADERF